MRRVISRLAVLLLSPVWGSLLACGGKIAFVSDGTSDYTIVLPKDATPAERRAAEELRTFLAQMSGASLPIVSEDRMPAAHRIFLGLGDSSRVLLRDLLQGPLGPEEFLLATKGQDLFVVGGRPRGTLYGVYALLEDQLGCRWYTREVSCIPKRSSVVLPRLRRCEAPAFEYREPFFAEAFDGDWAVRNRVNGMHAELDSSRGGKVVHFPFVHSFYQLVPPEKYFHEHPEYFTMVGGQRRGDHAQLCLTNPDVVRIATQQVCHWIEENPEIQVVSVSQNDWAGFCECEPCTQVNEAEGSPAGTLLRFVNAIADSVAKRYPWVRIETLAYTWSEKPPRYVKARPNVIVRLCHMSPACNVHSLYRNCPENRAYIEHLREWRNHAERIWVWEYTTDFKAYLMPFPNLDAVLHDPKFYRGHGVTGLFYEGSYPPGGGGEMAELRAWVLAKLLWNPNRDGRKLVHEFIRGVYGPAGKCVQEYVDLLHEQLGSSKLHLHLFAELEPDLLCPELLERADNLFRRARRAASGDSALLARVELAWLPVLYARLEMARRGYPGYLRGEEFARAAAEFVRIAKEHGIRRIRESGEAGNVERFIETLDFVGNPMRRCWVIGPFEIPHWPGLPIPFPPESGFDSAAVYTGTGGQAIRWQKWEASRSSYLDFVELFEPDTLGVAYAFARLWSPADTLVRFGLGSNDGVRAWVNGQVVHEKPIQRTALPNEDVFEVRLRKGWNEILVKVDQAGRSWGLYLSVDDLDGVFRWDWFP